MNITKKQIKNSHNKPIRKSSHGIGLNPSGCKFRMAESNLPHHDNSTDTHKSIVGDLDLSLVIANSLSSLTGENEALLQNEQDASQNNHEGSNADENDDDDLKDAIGNVFNQFDFDNQSEDTQGTKDNSDINLDDVIGKAFKTTETNIEIQSEQDDDKHTKYNIDDPHESQQTSNEDKQSGEVQLDNDDDLNDAIGAAFANAFGNDESEQSTKDAADTSLANKVVSKSADHGNYDNQSFTNKIGPKNKDGNDEDLADVIGNAVASLIGERDHAPMAQKEDEHKSKSNILNSMETVDKSHDEDLNNAIGSTLNDAMTKSDEDKEYKEPKNDEDLNEVIENVFDNLLQEAKIPEHRDMPKSANEEENEQLDLDLDEAIGNAFKSILPQQHVEDMGTQDDDLTAAISASFKKAMTSGQHNQAPVRRDSMESAITGAFKAAASKVNKSSKDLNLPHIVQLVTDSSKEKRPASQDALNELALEISNKVQSQIVEDSSAKLPKSNIPQLDENILEHFDNEAHHGAGASRLRLQSTFDKVPSTDTDLELLQMNDILQNAFNMAMENPYELLQDLEIDDVPKSADQSRVRLPPYVDSSRSRSSSSSFVGKSSRPPSYVLKKPSSRSDSEPAAKAKENQDLKKKELSIAETLALHRSNMTNTPRRNYALIESLNEALRTNPGYTGPIRSQISNVINSITARSSEASSSTETNVMSAIKEMMNILTSDSKGMSSLAATSTLTNVEGIMATYEDDEDKLVITKSLLVAKEFLESKGPSSVENSKAILLIDTILKQTKSGIEAEKSTTPGAYNFSFDSISDVSKSVASVLVSHSQSSKQESLLSIYKRKPTDTEDVKELVRLENRARKKKWREENAERNKDNDLRSRVWKKASILFGDEDSPKKKEWIETEFNKRREKRIARKGKQTNHASEDSKEAGLTDNIKFKKPLMDIFNMLSGFAHIEDANAILTATSAATAASAVLYAERRQLKDPDLITNATKSTISLIIENNQNSGNQKRLTALWKGANVQLGTPESRADSFVFHESKFSTNTLNSSGPKNDVFDPSLSKIGQKRPHSDASPGEKRLKNDNFSEDKDTYTKIASNLDQIRKSLNSTVSSGWGNNSALRIPQYRKPSLSGALGYSSTGKVENPTLTLPTTSPFISNKINLVNGDTHVSDLTATSKPGTLRKPGTFQRPPTRASKGKSMGFPHLLSTSSK